MPNYLDDFVCDYTIEEYAESYLARQMWEEAEYAFCEAMGLEVECYDD